jgi:hypothetical protein
MDSEPSVTAARKKDQLRNRPKDLAMPHSSPDITCPNCGGTRRAQYFSEQAWNFDERPCHVCRDAAATTQQHQRIDHPNRPDEADYEYKDLIRRIETLGGPKVVVGILQQYAFASPRQGSYAGSLWAIAEWLNERLSADVAQPSNEAREKEITRIATIEECALIAEGFDAACNSPRMKLFEEAGLVVAIYKRDGEIGAAIRALAHPSTPRDTPSPEPDYRDVVRNWFELRLSQQREIAASLGLPPPQGTSTGIEWGKLVLTTAKEKGELARVAAAITAALPSPEGK